MPKYNKEEIEKYYEVLGLDPNEEGLIKEDSINLSYIGELYELNEFDSKLPYTAKELSDSYSVLLQIIKDGFWYSTKENRDNAFVSAHEIIDDLTRFNVDVEDDPELTTIRKYNLKNTIIRGLCAAGNINDFRLYQKNASFNSVFNRICFIKKTEENNKKIEKCDEDDTPKDLKKLYYLIAYSRFKDDGGDFEMFDGLGDISLVNLKLMVVSRYRENAPLNDNMEEREVIKNPKTLRLSHYRKNKEHI